MRSGAVTRVTPPGRGAAAAEAEKPPEGDQRELQLVGEPASKAAAAPRRSGWLSQLGGSPLTLYLVTAAVVVLTGAWVVSDISRLHRPVSRPVVADAPIDAIRATSNDGSPLQPPARLGDGVVMSSEPRSSTGSGSAEALNALMRRAAEEEAAPAEASPAVSPEAVAAPAEVAPPPALTQENAQAEAPAAMASAEAPAPTAAADVDAPTAATMSKCLLKVDGKVLFQRDCSGERSASRATFTLGDKQLVIALSRGETWQATFGGKSLGAVYRTGQCWGRKKQVYICAE